MDDKEIIKSIKSRRFSSLSFLEDERLLLDNENYYGFLYFTLEAREEPTKELLRKITQHKGGLSKAYEYLGTIALKVFSDFDEYSIPASFFRLSVEQDEKNSLAWWNLFWVTREPRAFLESLKIDYMNNKIDDISNKVERARYTRMNKFDYSIDEWNMLIEILLDNKQSQKKEATRFLVAAYYYVDKLDDGVKLINQLDHVDVEIIRKYYELGKVDIDTALSKIFDFQLDEFLMDDYERIYDRYLERRAQGKFNLTKSGLIAKAFKAKRYNDLINLYHEVWDDDKLFQYDLEPRLYYLISQIYLKEPLDQEVYDYVRNNRKDDSLYKIFESKSILIQLEQTLNEKGDIDYPISVWGDYQKVEKLLEDSDLLNHYLYNEIYSELAVIERNWDKKYFKGKLNSIKLDLEESDYSYNDFVNFCHYGIENGHYNEVVEKANYFHNENRPTITTKNILGVCYERKGMHEESYEQYHEAIQIMEKYKDYNHVVIGNYLSSLKRIERDFTKEHYDNWRDEFNIALVGSFQWDRFLADQHGRLYKYSSFNLNTLDSLINQYFYLPEKKQLNDPIEMPNISSIGCNHLIDSEYRICSFSRNQNSMLMWSHYTENHQGIMIEYQFSAGLPAGCGIEKVKYTNGEKRKKEQDKYKFNQYLLTKNKEWSYEKEVRIISYKLDKIYYATYEHPNPDRSKINAKVVSITLGCNFPSSKMQLIMNLVASMNEKRKDHESKVLLRQAQISENNLFGLEYVPIEI